MRCMACGGEMILMNVVQDEIMGVSGFEYRTFACSDCQDIERRLVFTKQSGEDDTEPMPSQAAPPIAPASTVHDEQVAPSVIAEHSREGDTDPMTLQGAPPVAPISTVQDEYVAPSVITEHSRERDTEPMPLQAAPPVSPASTVHDEAVAHSGILSRVFAKISGH
jgi:hypothetical protein